MEVGELCGKDLTAAEVSNFERTAGWCRLGGSY